MPDIPDFVVLVTGPVVSNWISYHRSGRGSVETFDGHEWRPNTIASTGRLQGEAP